MSSRKHCLWVLNCLNLVRQNGHGKDLAFVGTKGGNYYPVHKPILACSSGYFHKLFEEHGNSFDPIIIENVDPEALIQCIDYIYTGYVEVTEDGLEPLLEAAELFQMEDMHKKCIDAAIARLHPDNIIDTLSLASEVSSERLHEAAEVYAQMCFGVFAKHDDFVYLDKSTLCKLLKHRKIEAFSERIAYDALMRWVEHDVSSRGNELPHLLELISLDHLPLQYLKSNVYMHNLIRDNVKCREQLKQTLFNLLDPKVTSGCGDGLMTADSMLLIDKGGKVQAFSPWNKRWRHFSDIPTIKGKFTAVTANKCIYLVSDYRKLFKLDIRENSWLEMTEMIDERGYPRAHSMDGMVYATGGSVASTGRALRTAERFKPELNEWEKLPSMKKPRSKHTLAVAGGYLYAIGGINNNGLPTKFVERYDPMMRSWSNMNPLKQARSGALAVVRDKWLYVIGGTYSPEVSVEISMHTVSAWTSLVLSIPKTIVSACVVANEIYILKRSDDIKASKKYDIWMLRFYGDQWSVSDEFESETEIECLTIL